MSNRIQKSKKYSAINERSMPESILLLFPLLMVVIVLPLIVKMHTYDPKLAQFDWYADSTKTYDFFLYYKQWMFVIMCGLMVLIIGGRAFFDKKTIKFHKALLPLAAYALLSLLSTLFSKYRFFGFTGIFEQFENVFCLMGYALVVYYAFLIIQSEAELKLMINAIAIGALILGIIGTFQAFGHDLFATDLGKSMIAGQEVDPDSLSIVFGEGRVYGTLYNPNYVGVYTSLMIPLFSVLLFFGKKMNEYILYGAVIITSVISLFGSQSKAGLISIATALFVAIIMFRKVLIKKWFILVPILSTLVITFFVINAINDNEYINAINNALQLNKAETPNITNITTSDDGVTITYKGNTLHVSLSEANEILLYDDDNNVVPYILYDQQDDLLVLQPQDTRFYEILIANYMDEDLIDFCLFIDERYWAFSNTAVPGTYTYYHRYGRFSPIETADSSIFTDYSSFASGRGYIWSRTIPLIKDNILLGSGADTFIIEFPQYDFLGFYNNGFEGTIISKPHSWYLQVAVQTGLVSLIALLVFFGWYLIQSFKLYWKNDFITLSSQIGLAAFIGSISYLISGISNDSSISVSPVFWVIIGVGFVANNFVKKDNIETHI